MTDQPGPADRLTVTVIICAFSDKRWDQLVAAIGSVQAQECQPDEIVVVIDHNDGLLDRLRVVVGTTVHCVPNEESRGLSGARNTGVATATGNVLVFLDDDARAEPGWLEHLLDAIAVPRAAVAGGSSAPEWEGGRRPPWFPDEFDWVVGSSHSGMPARRADVRNVIGCNMAFHRQPLAAAGGFSGRLGRVGSGPMGAEETEICIRIATLDPTARVIYEPRARIRHHVPAARQRLGYFLTRCWGEGRSKAILARLAPRTVALESEARYIRATLPRGIVRHLGAVLRGDGWGFARASVIAGGLGTTVLGYGLESAKLLLDRRRELPGGEPPHP